MNLRTCRYPMYVLLCSGFLTSANAQLSNLLGAGGADETAALSNPEFTKPVVLHIDPDGFRGAQRLRALNGVSNFGPGDFNEVGGLNDFPPCVEQARNAGNPGIGANIDRYNFGQGIIARWMSNNRFIEFDSYTVRYPKWGNSKAPATFVCPMLNPNVSKYFPPVQGGNLHNGLDIAIGRRVLTKWTHRNRYDTPLPGKGNVKVFAGTFTYRIDPLVPIVSFPGEGTATVKLFLNPDNGRWTIDNWQKQDPSISLLTNPLDPSGTAASEPPPMLSPPPAPPPPRRPVFFKEGKNDNDRQQDESVCGMAEINGQLKGKTWIDCMVQKGWQDKQPPVTTAPASAQQATAGQGDCKVFTLQDRMIIESPYRGGCKDGLADGQGSFTYFIMYEGTKLVSSVKGEFRHGKMNGNGTIVQQDRVLEGEFRENNIWNAIVRGVGKDGIKWASQFREGALTATCRADGKGEQNCTDREGLLRTR